MSDTLADKLNAILELNHQQIDPYCPWCGAKSYPVGGNAETAEYWAIDHECNCAITLIEQALVEQTIS